MMALNCGFRLAGCPDFPLSAICILSTIMSMIRLVIFPAFISKLTFMSMCPDGTFSVIVIPSASVALAVAICILILV